MCAILILHLWLKKRLNCTGAYDWRCISRRVQSMRLSHVTSVQAASRNHEAGRMTAVRCCSTISPYEGPCMVDMYEIAWYVSQPSDSLIPLSSRSYCSQLLTLRLLYI